MNTEKEFSLSRFRTEIEASGRSGRILDDSTRFAFTRDTIATSAEGPAVVLHLKSEEEVRSALSLARNCRLSVHPVSTGRNWGYGTSRPAEPSTPVIFDLSGMNRILAFNADLGIVTVEPGVTQGQLDAFLIENRAGFMVPTTGAGPSCSLVGNSIERGYGMTPISDHFQAVLGLRALLADGELYSSPLLDPDKKDADKLPVYRWGIGPYLDGVFSQNGGSIVTSMTFQLMARPEQVEIFVFWLKEDGHLERTVDAMRGLVTSSGLTIGGINLMNADRVSAVAGSKAVRGATWVGTGVVYGAAGVVKAGRSVIRHALAPHARRIAFVNDQRLRLLEKLIRFPIISGCLSPFVGSMRAIHRILSGHPDEFALALAYSANAQAMPQEFRNPARDGCGLLWYAPIVPMRGQSARLYTNMVGSVCSKYGFPSPITFSTISPAGFDSTVPLLFPRDQENSARAIACLRSLIAEGRKLGFKPYRFHSSLMCEATSDADNHWRVADRIRAVLDPERTIAPGRYERSLSASSLTNFEEECKWSVSP